MKKSYLLTKQAEADLREITLYTLKQWGKLQCNSYIAELEKKAEDVATGKGFYKEIPALLPKENSPALILAILHEKMDLVARLKHRLPS